MPELLGQRDELLRRVEEAFPDVAVVVRGNEINCVGPRAHQVGKLFEEMVLLLQRGEKLDQSVMDRSIVMVRAEQRPSTILTDDILKGSRGRMVRPKTAGQKRYLVSAQLERERVGWLSPWPFRHCMLDKCKESS
jgi:phosphate starvation-inducible PhoH-like protein